MKPIRIGEIYQKDRFGLSFEVFPPKTSQGDDVLLRTLEKLSVYRPAFISCTYGAGGSTRTRTVDWCVQIQQRFGVTATAHFTCVGSTVDELTEWLSLVHENGICNIMALRGDPSQGNETFQAVEGGLSHANELVSLIRDRHPEVGIGVAGGRATFADVRVRRL